MKVQLQEFDGCFDFEMQAENIEEAAALVRFGMNRTKIRTCAADVFRDGKFSASLVFGKNARAGSSVPKRL